jgi:hypothetical protein
MIKVLSTPKRGLQVRAGAPSAHCRANHMIRFDFVPKVAARNRRGAGPITPTWCEAGSSPSVHGPYFPKNPVGRASTGRMQGAVHAKARIAAL